MKRTRQVVAVLLLALTAALPAAALPVSGREAPGGILTALWARLAPVLGLFEKSRSGADPDGATTESRSRMDPDGATTDSRAGADPNGATTESRSGMDPNG